MCCFLDAAVILQDGNTDLKGIKAAVEKARAVTDKPSFIKVSTLIGYGSPNKANTHGVHGSPLGEQQLPTTARHSLEGVPLGDSAMQMLCWSRPKHHSLPSSCPSSCLLHTGMLRVCIFSAWQACWQDRVVLQRADGMLGPLRRQG